MGTYMYRAQGRGRAAVHPTVALGEHGQLPNQHWVGWRFSLVVTRYSRWSINVVTLRWARLVPGWVTAFGRVNYRYVTSHPGQLSLAIPL